MKLPEKMRPRGVRYREFTPGLDLPSWFYYGLKGIDQDFHLVYHPYQVIWENIINEYLGKIEDRRLTIHREFGELVFGLVLKQDDGTPTPDNSWHIWRYCDPYGWAHIVNVKSDHGHYLKLLLNRLHLQGRFSDKYGHKAYGRKLQADTEAQNEKIKRDKEELFNAVHEENKWLMDKAAENFERGVTAPTNPQKETIFSAPGVMNRTKTSRGLTDEEGGLVIPE